jgi:diadenosine tetraphosphatase ApaH/serine/threonine PP2A family protein phosphatase
MKVAIISDIHSNLEALSSVIDDILREEISSIINVGDTVGYGAEPDKCLDILMAFCGIEIALPPDIPKEAEKLIGKCSKRVAGNHDWGVLNKLPRDWFNEMAAKALSWTESRLSQRHISFLESLPLVERFDETLIVHSSPIRPEEFNYITSPDNAYHSLRSTDERIVIVGHSHIPGIFILRDNEIYGGWEYEYVLKDGERLLINAGSVGQPRDSDPRASYAIYDTDKKSIKILRVEYDIDTAANKIRNAGIPVRYADRLKWGL